MRRLFSSSAAARKSRIERLRETSVGKSLTIRALLVDSALFRRMNKEENKTEEFRVSSRFDPDVVTKDMLTKQVRAELRKRGLDGIGKPWVVKKRLEEARDAEKELAELDAKLSGETTTPTPPKQPPVEDIRAKYADRLRGRSATIPLGSSKQQGDAETLQFAKEAAHKSESQRRPSQWRIGPPGMRTLLEFVAARSMFLVLVTRSDTSDQELKELRDQAGVHFDLVTKNSSDAESTPPAGEQSPSRWGTVCGVLEIEPHQSLSFVDDDLAAREARNAGSLTCLLLGDDEDHTTTIESPTQFAGNNHSRSQRRRSAGGAVDYVVSKCAEVSDVINDLNGTSYRAAVLHYSA